MRKFWHISTGLLGLFFFYYFQMSSIDMGLILVGLAVAGFLLDILRLNILSFNVLAIKVLGPFMRVDEENSFSGLPFYALGAGASLLLFETKVSILAILYLIVGDPTSSFFGICFGSKVILDNKTLQGTIAGFIICAVMTFCYALSYGLGGGRLLVFSFLGGIIGSFSELFSYKINDNLFIPLMSGFLLTILNYFFSFL
jgi:diacylglycerol kinase (CTP)